MARLRCPKSLSHMRIRRLYLKIIRLKEKNRIRKRTEYRIARKDIYNASLFLALVIIWCYFSFYNSFFKIKEIEITGAELTNREEAIKEARLILDSNIIGIIPRDSYFTVPDERIQKTLEKKFALQEAKVKKIFPHKLEVNIKEKFLKLIYDNGKNYYLIDEHGQVLNVLGKTFKGEAYIKVPKAASSKCRIRYIVRHNVCTQDELKQMIELYYPPKELIQNSFGKYPVLLNIKDEKNYISGENIVLDSSVIKLTFNIYNSSRDYLSVFSAHHFEVDNADRLHLFMNDGWYIAFANNSNSWSDFYLLWKNILQNEKNKIEYVDLTVVDKAYYKFVE